MKEAPLRSRGASKIFVTSIVQKTPAKENDSESDAASTDSSDTEDDEKNANEVNTATKPPVNKLNLSSNEPVKNAALVPLEESVDPTRKNIKEKKKKKTKTTDVDVRSSGRHVKPTNKL